jgi:hypothetical protein
MKLELKHIAPYLPYDIKVEFELNYHSDYIPNETKDYEYKGICVLHQVDFEWISEFKTYKPILRPLSDLTKEIQIGEYFMTFKEHLQRMFPAESMHTNIATWSYRVVSLLFEWHFDVFQLIPNGLAIDINTIEQ